jgi:long-chain acyl-CoA synthetase
MKHIEGTLLGYEGCHLYYQSWQPEGISQAIVVLVHGLGAHSGVFQNVADYLVPQGYEVYALDLRGHGRSEGQRGYINCWQEFREDLHILLQQIRSQRACCPYILWGHSLGGTVVLDYILHFSENISEKIQGAIVTAPALSKINISPLKLFLGKTLSKIMPRFSLKSGVHHEVGANSPVPAPDPLRHEYGSARLATEFLATVDWIHNHAAEIKIPLLLMHGSSDRVTFPEGSRAFFQRVVFPDKEHHEYANSNHDLYVDSDARRVFTDLETWLDRHLEGTQTCQTFLGEALQDKALVPLGHTLPALLTAADRRSPNATGFNQWTELGWKSHSIHEFKAATDALALGLLELGLVKGDRVAFLMHNDLNFAIADMGCLLAGLVDVPIDLTQTLENICFVLAHSEAKALVVANLDLLKQIAIYLDRAPNLEQIIIAEVPDDWQSTKAIPVGMRSAVIPPMQNGTESLQNIPASACLDLHTFLKGSHYGLQAGDCLQDASRRKESVPEFQQIALPQCLQVFSMAEVQAQGQALGENSQNLRARLTAKDLATIIYIPNEIGKLEGVMLSHENLSGNALAAFASLPKLEWGDREVALFFLPLTHVFARCLFYGHLYYGHSIYFSHPNRILKHLKEVQPTVLASVPLLLEKFYSKILERGQKSSHWWERQIFALTLQVARQYKLGEERQSFWDSILNPSENFGASLRLNLTLKILDRLVFSQWRSLFGGRMKFLLSGGAALRGELATAFNAAGVQVLQGYGLTQTSGVVCFNRGTNHRAGTVGSPIPGVELAIAMDGEILVRGLYVTPGYYKNEEATRAAIDAQGWLHTGDLGAFTDNGLLQIVGMKKALFKLSTGKYIAPQPLEDRLKQSNLVDRAVIVGIDQKFCAALLFPNFDALRDRCRTLRIRVSDDKLLQHPCVLALYQAAIDATNCHLPYWATIKRFQLIDTELNLEAGLLEDLERIDRGAILERFADEIELLYGNDSDRGSLRKDRKKLETFEAEEIQAECAPADAIACPVFNQSLNPRFTT